MSRIRNQAAGKPSILDRLIDEAPELTQEASDAQGISIDVIRSNVSRDLEDLLNTRISWVFVPERFGRVRNSIITYGIPDLNNVVLDSRRSIDWLAGQIAESITKFDTRLSRVRVIVENLESESHELKFRIDAVLDIDPEPINVQFAPFLDMVRRQFKVSRSL
jgi:type VI secretion system protein ImpF